MNIASLIAIIILLALLIPAVRYLYKNGTCGSCPDKCSCNGKCKGKEQLKELMKDPDYKDKSDRIDNILKKYRANVL